ncbi:MAG: hypothetical protein K0V04_35905 [Deltaproteobacteria bacterium]|nr:hypothetical protein [Deltaproteobacteria bacterium]
MRLFRHPAWPHIRAVLIGLHVLSLAVLSLPNASAVHDRRRWRTANAQADLEQWTKRLQGWGFDTDKRRLAQSLWSIGGAYLTVQRPIVTPFAWYARVSGSRQGWHMFASPQRHPAELHVEIERDGAWVLIYRPHSDEHAWNREQFEHNRFRKFLGRFARGFIQSDYEHTARWVAARAAADHPAATQVRVRLYRYQTLPPAAVVSGGKPKGRYERERVFEAEALR